MSSLAFHPANFTDDFQKRQQKVNGRKKDDFFSEKNRDKINRALQIIIAVLIVVLIAELLFHFFIASELKIKQIVINAKQDFPMTNEEILNHAGLSGETYYFSTDILALEAALEEIPAVASATVVKHFPDTLSITLQERIPLTYTLVSYGGYSHVAVVDEEGVIFDFEKHFPEQDLPIVSGIQFNEIYAGISMPESILPFFNQLNALKSKSPLLYSLISEIKFVKKERGGFDAMLFLSSYPVKIRIAEKLNVDLLKSIIIVLDIVKNEGIMPNLDEIDFRTDEVVYKLREE